MCQEKMIFEERPRKVLLFAKSPKNFMVRQIFNFLFLTSRSKKNVFAGKGDLLIYFLIK